MNGGSDFEEGRRGKREEREEMWTFLLAIFDHHGKHILPQCLNL